MLKKIKPEQNHDLIQQQETKETETKFLYSEEHFDQESVEIYSQILANIIVQKILEYESR